jgi:TRAP-type mannitol/chloroaromatic compound transport system substrate-binding protein
MLNGINTGGRYLTVTGGTSSTYVNKNYSSNGFMSGDMRYDLDSQCIKVFDGSNWVSLVSGYATVELSYEAQSLLDWAAKKKNEEMLLEKQAQENPAIKDLVDQIKQKQDQIKMVQTLIKKEVTVE